MRRGSLPWLRRPFASSRREACPPAGLGKGNWERRKKRGRRSATPCARPASGTVPQASFLAPSQAEERTRLHDELEEAKDKARRRSIGNIKFIGELFKLRMLTEAIMHDCVVKLLKNHDEESLECLCRLLNTIGKDLDFEKAKVGRERGGRLGARPRDAGGPTPCDM